MSTQKAADDAWKSHTEKKYKSYIIVFNNKKS